MRTSAGSFWKVTTSKYLRGLGIAEHFVQDNHSFSTRNVLRGLALPGAARAQAKLVRVPYGEILDVAVDLRRSSPTFGKWQGVRLSGENKRMLWIPAGCAHGFVVLSETAHVLYKVDRLTTLRNANARSRGMIPI